MTALLTAIERMQAIASAGFAKPPGTQPNIQRQMQAFDASVGEPEARENLVPLLQRAADTGLEKLSRGEVNRILRGAWHDPQFDDVGAEAIKRAETEIRRSSDQAVIDGYLVHFPVKRPIIVPLAAAARRAAYRHAWAWQRRAEQWNLFDPTEGPVRSGGALANSSSEPSALIRDMGLGSSLAATQFGRRTFVTACEEIASSSPQSAYVAQRRILALFDADEQSSDLPELVQALLQPWISTKPESEHRKQISAFLVDQVGDPRVAPHRWKHIIEAISAKAGAARANEIVGVLKRWLTDVAMREFFKAIAKTTDRPDQWRQRSNFWLAYLDAGLVDDAWPALGIRARRQIEDLIRSSGERPEYGTINGGPQSSSSIIMKIGDLRIAEWSDNGSCRFWGDDDRKAPKLYSKVYQGDDLRTTYGRADFEYYAHNPSPGWEPKFAGIIHRRTGILHPTLGKGRGRYWNDTW